MELMTKQGYKQTEVGLIPEDWKVKALGDVGDVQMCKRIFSYQTSKRGEVPFYKIGTFGKEPNAFISWDLYQEFRKKYSFPKKGYLLISASGTIGRTVEYLGEDAYYQDSNIIWIDNDEKLISNKYLYYTLKVIKYKTEGSTIKRLYNSIIKSSKFVIPPTLTEQKAIATALSDVDALIACLEQTITKKKAIKQGAMQQLLTPPHKGGKRLPGFSGEWAEKTLGEVYNITKGQLITEKTRIDGPIPVIAGGKSAAYHHNKANRFGSTITVSGSGANAGYVAFHSYPIFASDCSTIEESKSYSIEFIYFFLKLKQNDIYNAQTGGAQPHIHPTDLNPMVIDLPEKDEQKAIAQILSDMDAEITQLETKKEKYQAIKQGMMQELLTGKTRLI